MKKKLIRVTTVSLSLYKLLDGQLSYLNQYYDVVGVASDTGELQKVAEREKVRVVDIKMARRISLFSDLKSLFALIKLFKKEKPYFVHSNTSKSLLAMLAARITGVPQRIHTASGLLFEVKTGFMRWFLLQIERLICRLATKVIPEGEGVRQKMLKYKITKKPLVVVGNGNINGINLEHFNPENVDAANLRAELSIADDDLVYLFIGRLVRDKGIAELIDAFAEIHKQNAKTKLVLVGGMEENLDPLTPETLTKMQQMKDSVLLCGYRDDVRPYFKIADVFVFPSYREGFPNVVLQAGAMNLPSIVTNISGNNEIIEDNVNGLIVDTHNVPQLLKAMLDMQNVDVRQRMTAVARQMIASRYDCHYVWGELLKMYQSLEK